MDNSVTHTSLHLGDRTVVDYDRFGGTLRLSDDRGTFLTVFLPERTEHTVSFLHRLADAASSGAREAQAR